MHLKIKTPLSISFRFFVFVFFVTIAIKALSDEPPQSSYPVPLLPPKVISQSLGSGSLFNVDFNNDKATDIVAINVNGMTVNYQDKVGQLSSSQYFPLPRPPLLQAELGDARSILINDINNDQFPDIVYQSDIFHTEPKDIIVLKQNPNGSLSTPTILPFNTNIVDMRVKDVNGDSRVDIVFLSTDRYGYWLQNSDGTFSTMQSVNVGNISYESKLSDLNNDGLEDILYSTSRAVEILYQVADLEFGTPVVHPFPDGFIYTNYTLDTYDVDGNNLLDIFVLHLNNGRFSVFQQKAVGQINYSGTYISAVNASSVEFGDINLDGRLDIVVPGSGNSYYVIHYQKPDGTFYDKLDAEFIEQKIPFSEVPHQGENSIVVADINNDGAPDITAANGELSDVFSYHLGFAVFYNSQGNYPTTDIELEILPQSTTIATDTIEVTTQISNLGQSIAEDVLIFLEIPWMTDFVSYPDYCHHFAFSLVCSLGNMDPGVVHPFNIEVKTYSNNPITITAEAFTTTLDYFWLNNNNEEKYSTNKNIDTTKFEFHKYFVSETSSALIDLPRIGDGFDSLSASWSASAIYGDIDSYTNGYLNWGWNDLSTKGIPISPTDDSITGNNRSFTVNVNVDTNHSMNSTLAEIVIVDNDKLGYEMETPSNDMGNWGSDLFLPGEVLGISSIYSNTQSIETGDFNSDGLIDFVTYQADSIHFYLQQTEGGWLGPLTFNLNHRNIATGDVNNDGADEIISGGLDDNQLEHLFIYKLTQDLELQELQRIPTNTSYKCDVADLNNDGLLDVVAIDWGLQVQSGPPFNNDVNVYLQNAGGELDAAVTYQANHGGYDSLTIGDVNGDGRDDVIVLSGQYYGFAHLGILTQTAEGTLNDAIYLNSDGPDHIGGYQFHRTVATADLNNDGMDELLLPGSDNNNLWILSDAFAQQTTKIVSRKIRGNSSQIAVGDFNQDGLIDYALYDSGISVYIQNSDTSFTPFIISSGWNLDVTEKRLVSGDFNNDGLPDLAYVSTNGVSFFYNKMHQQGDLFISALNTRYFPNSREYVHTIFVTNTGSNPVYEIEIDIDIGSALQYESVASNSGYCAIVVESLSRCKVRGLFPLGRAQINIATKAIVNGESLISVLVQSLQEELTPSDNQNSTLVYVSVPDETINSGPVSSGDGGGRVDIGFLLGLLTIYLMRIYRRV